VIPVLAYAAAHLEEDLSLRALASQAGLSPFQLHRVFSAAAGETPKQFTLRLRLGRAAVLLLTGDDSVLDIALGCGFQSHEVFIRAFRRQFAINPSAYRARGFVAGAGQATAHAELVQKIGPCVGLYHKNGRREEKLSYSITKKELSAQPVLVVRRKVKPTEIAVALAEVLGQVFLHAQKTGTALVGQPFTRYVEWGPGLLTIEAGLPVAVAPEGGEGVLAAELPGGHVATTTHSGPYDTLREAHAALQVWIEAQGLNAAGAPWEVYVTDPADHPDPKDWKTDVFWPIKS
jgi:AraC family transcriptional regulator